jgi:TolB protein
MFPPEFEPYEQPIEEPRRSAFKNCLMVLMSMVMIVALLGSAVFGAIYILRDRAAARAVSDTSNPLIPTLAANPRPSATDVPAETTSDDQPTPVPLPTLLPGERINRIVYVATDGRVATIAPDGSDGRFLTEADQRYLFPLWSPTSDDVAVIGADLTGSSVYLLHDDGHDTAPTQLYFNERNAPIYMYWSPNGRHLGFITNHPTGGIGLHIATPGESDQSRLLTLGQPFYWNWTADAQQLLIHTGVTGHGRLSLIDVDGDGEGDDIAAPGAFQSPGISVDGRYWAYAEEIGDDSYLVVADTASGDLQRQAHQGQVAMSWSPTANQLAFISGEPDSGSFYGSLRLLDAATGEIESLSRGNVLAFFWSPDGRSLAYFAFGSGRDTEIQALNRQRLGKPVQQRQLQIQLFVVDVTTGEGLQLASFSPTLPFLTQFLPFFDQYALSHRLWSPDSDALVLPMLVDDETGVFVVPVGGGQARQIANGRMAFWSQR